MSVQERYDAGRNVLFVTLEGGIDDEDLLKYAASSAGNPSIPSGHDILVDMSAVESVGTIRSETLRRIADLFTRTDTTPEQSRVAMVAPTDVGYGLSRMYQTFRSESPIEVRVFREMDLALDWLGLASS